ncbi:MAG: hypothetical protein ABEJ94_00080 [Halorientalis sp.]
MAVLYLLLLAPLALIAIDPTRDLSGSGWQSVTGHSLVGAALGAVVGGGLVFGIPDWLSTTLPLVALSATAAAFVFAGDAVPVRGLDTAMWGVAGTVCLFVVPVVLSLFLGGIGSVLAVPVGAVSVLAVRHWLGTHSPVDRRVSISLALVFGLVAGGVIAHDLSGPRPTAELDAGTSVNLSAADVRWYGVSDHATERPMVRVGTVTVTNTFGFSRTADLPVYRACLDGPNGTRPSAWGPSASPVETAGTVSPVDEIRLDGGERRRFPVVVLLDQVEGRSVPTVRALGQVPVQRADSCPGSTDGPALVLVPVDSSD